MLNEIEDQYGFVESGLFALALTKKLTLPIVAVRAYGFPIHICVKLHDQYIDAFGISTKTIMMERSCQGYLAQDITFTLEDEIKIKSLTKFSPAEYDNALATADLFIQSLKITRQGNQNEKIA